MSDAFALTYVDASRNLFATARSEFALIFRDGQASSHDTAIEIETNSNGWDVRLPGDIELALTPVSEGVELGGMRAQVAADGGTGLAVFALIDEAPRWQELDATRWVTALFDREHALLAFARRPAGAPGHGQELVKAHLWADGELKAVEDARLSTIYDGGGRPRQASMELWLPGEDFPRRAFGRVAAGASLALEGLDVHAAAMTWFMEGRDGAGIYELTVREPAPAAA